jgi:hypothetical protein
MNTTCGGAVEGVKRGRETGRRLAVVLHKVTEVRFRAMRDKTPNHCVSAELIESEAARIPDPNHWRAIAFREMARMNR